MTLFSPLKFVPLLLAGLCVSGALATEVYKCSDSQGNISYQGSACPHTQKQQVLQLSGGVDAPLPAASASIATSRDPQPVITSTSIPVPSTPLPQMYACRHAVDGKPYTSENGNPQPFLAPLGVLGAISTPLADVYGAPNNAGISAPEVNRGRVTSDLVANNYVWVRDTCRPMSQAETCAVLRTKFEQNAKQLHRAFKSDRAPLQQRDDTLRAQLTNC